MIQSQQPAQPTVNKKKTLEDHYFYVGLSKQASDFDITYEFLLNRIKERTLEVAKFLKHYEQ